jgi:hypothetical protein
MVIHITEAAGRPFILDCTITGEATRATGIFTPTTIAATSL